MAVKDRQAVTTRPGDGPMDAEAAVPLGEKLTGACGNSTLSSNGLPAGPESRACQRTACTVSRKLSVSDAFETVTGK